MHPNDAAITDYIDGTLDVRERAEIDRHLESCAPCRRLVEDFREIKSVAANLDLGERPVRSGARVERAIKFEEPPRAARRSPAWAQTRTIAWLAAAVFHEPATT